MKTVTFIYWGKGDYTADTIIPGGAGGTYVLASEAEDALAAAQERERVLREALKELLDALSNCPGSFNYSPKIEDKARAAL